jgi:hypothetical protein
MDCGSHILLAQHLFLLLHYRLSSVCVHDNVLAFTLVTAK